MMDALISNPVQQDRRNCERIELNRSMLLKLSDGQMVDGITVNISLGGVKISTVEKRIADCVGQSALLHIKLVDGQLSPGYPCTIIRSKDDSVCLKLDKKKSSSFGTLLTRGIFKRKQLSV